MKNCLITTLKEAVSNPSLKTFSENIDFSQATGYNLIISGSTNKWTSYQQYSCKLVEVSPNDALMLTNNKNDITSYAFLKEQEPVKGTNAAYASGTTAINIAPGEIAEAIVPSDAVYLYVTATDSSGNDTTPDVVVYGM